MKKLLGIFLISFSTIVLTSTLLEKPISTKVKIINPRKHKLIMGELHRTLEHSIAALNQYKQQNQLNKELPAHLRTSSSYADIQKHLATYNIITKIYNEYQTTQQLAIPYELLTALVQDPNALSMLLREAIQEEEMTGLLQTNSLAF